MLCQDLAQLEGPFTSRGRRLRRRHETLLLEVVMCGLSPHITTSNNNEAGVQRAQPFCLLSPPETAASAGEAAPEGRATLK